MKTIILIIGLSFLFIDSVSSQSPNLDSKISQTNLISKAYGDSIVVRLVTQSFDILKNIHDSGYDLVRYEVDLENQKLLDSLVVADNIKMGTLKLRKYSSENREFIDDIKQEIFLNREEIDAQAIIAKRELLVLMSLVAGSSNPDLAELMGIRFVDKDVEKGKSYHYHLRWREQPDRLLNGLNSLVSANEYKPYYPTYIDRADASMNQIVVHWDSYQDNGQYFGYDIERSVDSVYFVKLNEEPLLNLYDESIASVKENYIDKVDNNIKYFYRVIGYSHFGERGEPSSILSATARDDQPPLAPSFSLDSIENIGVAIQWQIEDLDTEKITIEYTNDLNGEFEIVANPAASELQYIDNKPIVSYRNYYRVCALDTVDNKSCSPPKRLIVQDLFPPSIPTGLSGEIDSSGIVTLNWDANTEDDLWGYYVYGTNDLKTNFLRISNYPIKGTSFKDTIALNTLTKRVYYRVAALDKRTNISDLSKVEVLSRPDTIPPSPALIISVKSLPQGVEIAWNTSAFLDVERQLLQRRVDEWKTISDFGPTENRYLDTLQLSPKSIVAYRIISADHSDNQAVSNEVGVKIKDFSREIEPQFSLSQRDANVTINWDNKEISELIIYRAQGEHKIKSYERLKAVGSNSWVDSKVDSGKSYKYMIRYILPDGSLSKFSSKKFITLNI